MLKCNIDRYRKRQRTKGKGTPHDLMVETAALIGTVHLNIRKQSPEAAEEYRLQLIGTLLDPDSPVWKGE